MNKLVGRVTATQSSGNISIIKVLVGEDTFSAIILECGRESSSYRKDDAVTLLFKETEVGLAKNLSGLISFRNRFMGKIKKIDEGQLLTRVTLAYQDRFVQAVITTQAAVEMALREKEQVEWMVKTSEVTLMKNPA